jgi:hypothetical protein
MKSTTHTKAIERYVKRVQKKIRYCDTCQPYDGGETVWIYGSATEMDDLLRDCNVPYEKWDEVMPGLHCPFCGNENLDLSSTIGVKEAYEIKFEKEREDAIEKHYKAIVRFHTLLTRTPMLALKDRLGRTLRKEIREYSSTFSLKGNVYRAKKNEGEKPRPLVSRMRPKRGYAEEGRFNHAGQPHLYLCFHEFHAESEVNYDLSKREKVWVQKFNVVSPIDNILDITYDYDGSQSKSALLMALFYSNTLVRTKRNKRRWKPDYLMTRFLMDVAKDAGFNGILYNSARHHGKNIVLFNQFEKIKAIKRPYLYEVTNDEPSVIF